MSYKKLDDRVSRAHLSVADVKQEIALLFWQKNYVTQDEKEIFIAASHGWRVVSGSQAFSGAVLLCCHGGAD
jgi:hypothetical protein